MVSSSLDNGEPLSFFEFETKMNNEAEGRPEEYQEMGKVSKTMEKKRKKKRKKKKKKRVAGERRTSEERRSGKTLIAVYSVLCLGKTINNYTFFPTVSSGFV